MTPRFAVGLTLVLVVEGAKVVVITPVGDKHIGNEFQDRGLPGTSLSNEKDRVWCFRLIRRTLDDPLPETLRRWKIRSEILHQMCCGYPLGIQNIIPNTGINKLVVRRGIAAWASGIDGRLISGTSVT